MVTYEVTRAGKSGTGKTVGAAIYRLAVALGYSESEARRMTVNGLGGYGDTSMMGDLVLTHTPALQKRTGGLGESIGKVVVYEILG